MADRQPRDRAEGPNPRPPQTGRPTMAAEHLRNDIDAGRTGDKIRASDPAAAPLGTDDEAAGRRPADNIEPFPRRRHDPSDVIVPGHAKGWDLPRGRGVLIALGAAVAAALVLLLLLLLAL